MKVRIINKQTLMEVDKRKIFDIIERVERNEECTDKNAFINVVFVDNDNIRKINKKFLNRNDITDVIAFPQGETIPGEDKNLVGEIVISVEKAIEEAKNRDIQIEQELYRYVIHGFLHLLHYDDISPEDRKKMKSKEEYYLNCSGVS